MGVGFASMKLPTKSTAAFFPYILLLLLKYLLSRLLSSFGLNCVNPDRYDHLPSRQPSLEEIIEPRLPVIEFGRLIREEEEEQDDPRCSICMLDVRRGHLIRELGNCRHVFHRPCIDQWMQKGGMVCPLCRALLLPSFNQSA